MKLFLLVVSTQNSPMAHNGLGYLYFVGTPSTPANLEKAVYHFTLVGDEGFAFTSCVFLLTCFYKLLAVRFSYVYH